MDDKCQLCENQNSVDCKICDGQYFVPSNEHSQVSAVKPYRLKQDKMFGKTTKGYGGINEFLDNLEIERTLW